MIHTSETLRDAFHYLFPDELPELKRLAKMLPPGPIIVNIGAGAGTSGLAFKEARPDCTLYTIDVTDEASPFGCLEAERDVMTKAGFTLGDGWYQIHGDSKLIDFGQADMVFVDGDHTYEGCKGDIQVWLPRVRTGGILSIHDYQKGMIPPNEDGPHPKAWPGVDRAVDELLVDAYDLASRVDSLISFWVTR